MVNRFKAISQWLGRIIPGRLALACILTMAACAAGAQPKFEASLDRNDIMVGETVTLSMTFTGGDPGSLPNVPPINGLQFGAQGSSTQMTIIGSQMTSTATYTLEMQGTRPGEYTIPSLSAEVNGTVLRSRSLRLRVRPGGQQPQTQPNGAPMTAFVRVVPAATKAYVGQLIPVEVQGYCLDNVDNIQLPQLASDNFIVGNLPNNPGRSRIRQGNADYNLFNFRVAARPTRTGTLQIGPASWSMRECLGQRTFFGWTGGMRPLTVTSDTVNIDVRPVPTQNAPPDFSGAIGRFTLAEYEAGPTTVGVGDPITLKIRINGSGSFDSVVLPPTAQEWREFKTYPPTAKFDTSDPLQIEGSKYFEQVITPLNAQIKEVPGFSFSFFDPATGSFQRLAHPPIPLTVHPTAATPQPTIIASGTPPPDAQQQNQEIVHIKPQPGVVRAPAAPLVLQPAFLAWQALPPLIWIGALIWRQQKDKLANNPRLRRHREVARLVQAGLGELQAHASANDTEKFHTTALRLLQEQLGERLDIPAPAITEAVLDDLKGMDNGERTLLRELFHACDQYRYAPEHTSQALTSLIPKIKTALAALQKMPANGERAGKKMLQGVGMVLLLLASAVATKADSVSDKFLQANKLYEEGKYSQAAAIYESLLKEGQVSPEIYFNAGNAWFKADQLGRAIHDYRRAEQQSPRDPDIRANLEIARTKAGANAAALPGSRWTRWVGRVTLNEWAWAASITVALFFLALAARQISPAFSKSSGTLVGLLAAGSVWLLICLWMSIEQQLLEKSSIVIVSEAVVRRGPLDESQSAFTAHDGAEMMVLARDGDWLQVSDTHQIGWVQQKDVVQMP